MVDFTLVILARPSQKKPKQTLAQHRAHILWGSVDVIIASQHQFTEFSLTTTLTLGIVSKIIAMLFHHISGVFQGYII